MRSRNRSGHEVERTLRAAAEMPARELGELLIENDGTLPPRVNTAIRFPPDVHVSLTKAAEERGLSMNYLVVAATREFLDHLLPPDEIKWTR